MEKENINSFAQTLIEESEKYNERDSENFLAFKRNFFIWFDQIKPTLLDSAKNGKRKFNVSFSNFPRGKGTSNDVMETHSDVVAHYMKLISNDYFNDKIKMFCFFNLMERTYYVNNIIIEFYW